MYVVSIGFKINVYRQFIRIRVNLSRTTECKIDKIKMSFFISRVVSFRVVSLVPLVDLEI